MSVLQTILHPLIRKLGKSLIKFPITPFDVHPIPKKKPVIFAVNHSCVHDFPTVLSVMSEHYYVLTEDGPKGSPAGFALSANGCVWVNRSDKVSRKACVEQMRHLLKKGNNLMIYLEGTWNIHECLPMLPFTWSTTELAREFQVPIVPVTLEYPDFESCFYSIGEPVHIAPDEDKKEAAARLRDTMATMRWKFWESKGVFERSSVTRKDFDIYAMERFREYRPNDYAEWIEREKDFVFHPYTTPEKAFAHLKELVPSRANAFLFGKRIHN